MKILKTIVFVFFMCFYFGVVSAQSLVSVTSSGVSANGNSFNPSVSHDGSHVAFQSLASNLVSWDINARQDIFLKNVVTGEINLVSLNSSGVQTNGSNYNASISGNAQFVVFQSTASNLVPGDTNSLADIFIRDMQNLTTSRVSVSSSGEQANGKSTKSTMSSDGRYVAFESDASNLVPGDTNAKRDLFRHDRID